ncbi:MAG: altronate dehydratase family protein [Syntrophobacterales bacterium]|nr:altronate dehydratase family protein [Syntrophobacterales bacterium]
MTAGKKRQTIRLHDADNVIVALGELVPGTSIPEENITCRELVPAGHKVATATIHPGQPILKYNQIIGFAKKTIEPGQHIHLHNLTYKEFERDHKMGADARTPAFLPEERRATFQGIIRKDGQIATRNYIGVVATVNCSATVVRRIAQSFSDDMLADFPNVDGIVPLCHETGCGHATSGEAFEMLQRTLTGYIRHPNFAGVLVVGLGCEKNSLESLFKNSLPETGALLNALSIQDCGGTTATIRAGAARVREMLPEANKAKRSPVSASHIVLGLECGGSDAYSGITANPALGEAANILVQNGGTAVLSETPEIYGAEHLLIRRAVNKKIGEKLLARIDWWKDYLNRNRCDMDNNPSPGNKAGGLTTILEKSLGAVAKGGTTPLMEVYDFACPIREKGLVFMDTPGYDPVSVAGMVAGGANVIAFTTGRGSVFGCKPSPVIKLATNTELYRRMQDDMDINCGAIADGESTVARMGEQIFRSILETASGIKTKSELLDVGDNELVLWNVGAVL